MISPETKYALETGRLRILRKDKNRGKGSAIRLAIKDCLAKNFTHILTFDGDGQHLVSEISKVCELGKNHPWDLIIGHRRMQSESVPGSSKFGRAFSNFWVNFQTGKEIADSQSGFRLYPLFHIQNMKFWCNRYDFEIEVLIRLMWKGVEIRETEIEVFYPEKAKRISHFNKLWDNVRISILNTFLVILSLLNSHRSPWKMALAVGLGVLIGCTPFYGFHTLIVAIVSFLFRLNAPLLWIGSQISIPPLLPFLIIGSMIFGQFFFPKQEVEITWSTLSNLNFNSLFKFAEINFLQWLQGSLILGFILGLMVGLLILFLNFFLKLRRNPRSNWNGKSRGGLIGNGFIKLVLRFIGLKAVYFCLYFIVPYFYFFAPKSRRAMNEYYTQTQKGIGYLPRQILVLKHLFRFGQVLADRLFKNINPKNKFKNNSNGLENIINTNQYNQGLILLSAHVGGWDIGSTLLENQNFKNDLYLVEYLSQGLNFKKVKGPENKNHLKDYSHLPKGPTIFELHQALRQNKVIALMADRPLGNRFELLNFFGKLAPFDTTPFRIAAASRVPLIFTFGFRAKDMTYDFYADPARYYSYKDGLDPNVQCYNWVKEFVEVTEKLMVKYPDQWFNFYPFWSSLPSKPEEKSVVKEKNHLIEELYK
jgi:predicted LPLAT superfamily acyltransferase/uncharacterized protein (DUF2062 family)